MKSRCYMSGPMQVCQVDSLSGWQLYLVDWGKTQQREGEGARNPRIKVVSLEQLQQATGCC